MPQERDMSEMLDAYMDQEKLHRLEGRRGVEAMCQIAGALGYKDPQYYGQLTRKATLGDLILMLEDNSGLVEAMIEWTKSIENSEWKEALESQLIDE